MLYNMYKNSTNCYVPNIVYCKGLEFKTFQLEF